MNEYADLVVEKLNPHFLNNCINNIYALIMTERNAEAMEYLHDFSRCLNGVIAGFRDASYIAMDKEIQCVKSYIDLQKLRYNDALNVNWNVGRTDFEIIPMTLYFIVDYFTEKGISNSHNGGTLDIWVDVTDGHKKIIVTLDANIDMKPDNIILNMAENIGKNGGKLTFAFTRIEVIF